MSNSVLELDDTKCILIFGYNPAASHPIVAKHIVAAKEKGAKIIVCDPRVIESARIADLYLPIKNGCNIAIINALAYVLITEELYDKEFVQEHTEGFDAYWKVVKNYKPEDVEDITGISGELVRKAARMYGGAETATICYGMGVTQWDKGTEGVKSLSGLALLTGNLGKPNVGINPVRGQNNVQGSCDMGVLPNTFPGYQKVTDPEARAKFEKYWGVENLPDKVGKWVSMLPHYVETGEIRAFYCMGEDPVHTEPDSNSVAKALSNLDFMISQDIFMTETATYADVIFPATSWGEHDCVYTACDRGFQLSTAALPKPYETKHDWEIIALLSTAMGYPMHYNSCEEIWNELRELCPYFYGVTWEKLQGMGYVQWPCTTLDSPGTPYLFKGGNFNRSNGKGLLFATEWTPPVETPDEEYPLALCTIREVGHYSCRSMTGNCRSLTGLHDEPGYVSVNPKDAEKLGIKNDELCWISSRRGKVIIRAEVTERANEGVTYMSYQWWIGCCNKLTLHHLSATTHTPEYKYCAVKLERIEDQVEAERYLQEEYKKLKDYLNDTAAPQNQSLRPGQDFAFSADTLHIYEPNEHEIYEPASV